MIKTFISINFGNLKIITIQPNFTKNFTYLYVYNKNLYCVFKNYNTFFLNILTKNTNVISLNYNKKYFEIKKYLIFFFKNWNNFFFQKIKFTGKGYKIRKKKKTVKFLFGRSHLTYIWFNTLILKRLNKYKLFIATKKKKNIFYIFTFINKIRKLNIFTKRGLRYSRQFLYKKTGKKSSYM